MYKIAIFASGSGTNAENIARYFANDTKIKVSCILSNNENAGVHTRMKNIGITSITFTKDEWNEATHIVDYLKTKEIDLIVLAGFMSMINKYITSAYAGRIINIHPSLLPKFGGKGMWGMNVHKAVINAHETESGITIHHVNNIIDGGSIILQAKCPVLPTDTPEELATRIHALEYRHYPLAITNLLIK
ncbi:MAG: phosphoribosylglycinamide formyltransferase [Muribaculaceae bacterium]